MTSQEPMCDKLKQIRVEDEWWFYQCVGRPKDETGKLGQDKIDLFLSCAQQIFDNRWYRWLRNLRQGRGVCANLILGGVQNTVGNVLRLGENLHALGGPVNLDNELIKRLKNPRTCSAAILELEIAGCFAQAGYAVELYPAIAEGKPEAKVRVGDLDIYVEVVHLDWPAGERFLAPQKSQGRKMAEKILRKYDQLPEQGPGVIVANPPHFLAPDTSGGIAERLHGLLKPDLHTRVSALILASKWAERSGFIKPYPVVTINGHAKKRCDKEVSRLADALVKYPDWW